MDPDVRPEGPALSAQIVGYFQQITSLPASGLASSGLNTNDYSKEVPFTDNSDKGDLRFLQRGLRLRRFERSLERREFVVHPGVEGLGVTA